MRTSRAVAVSALLAVAAVNLLAACTPEDDSDVFETPGPADPTPTPPDYHCQIVWASQNAEVASAVDVFVIDAPEASWVAGVSTFGEFTGFYQPELDLAGFAVGGGPDDLGGIAVSTANSFTIGLNINGTSDGSDVSLASATTAELLVMGTDGSPTTDTFGIADAFDFDGVWSSRDPESPAVEIGAGTADLILVTGTNTTPVSLGDFGQYAICYDSNGVAQLHPVTAAGISLKRWHR